MEQKGTGGWDINDATIAPDCVLVEDNRINFIFCLRLVSMVLVESIIVSGCARKDQVVIDEKNGGADRLRCLRLS